MGRKSGIISLRRGLEGYRTDYTLTIAAYDGGSPPYSAEIPVKIKVVDKSVPTFSRQSFQASVAENAETFSAIISATAESPSSNGHLIYTIESGNEEELFSVDYNEGVVYLAQSLDYERKQQHQLTLRATDSAAGGYTEAILFISVLDVNDCTPEFSQPSYEVEVSEATPRGSVILHLAATDGDTGPGGQIEFSLRPDVGNASQVFVVDPETGDVRLVRGLDRERQSRHRLMLAVTDRGPNPHTGLAHAWVTVLDTNDNAPAFEEAEYTFRLSDRAERGQLVGGVRAVDPDTSDHQRIQYSIIGGNEHQVFSIEEDSGLISLVNLHNFASVAAYRLNVSVTDGVYSTTAKVTVRLTTGNNYAPEFGRAVYEVKFRENQPAGSLVGRIQAQDKDGDSLRYSLMSDHLGSLFRLEASTGRLYSQAVLDREDTPEFEIPVQVADQAGRNDFTTVKLSLTDENDNSPSFPLSEYKANIPANLTVGSTVLSVTAEDQDKGKNAAVKYEIYETENSGVDDIFRIDANTGQIKLQRSAADLQNQVYQFFVRAGDAGRPPLHADVPVEILVLGVLDTPPRFEERDSVYFLSEGSAVGTVVAQLAATLPEHSSPLRYSLASTLYSGPDSPLQIDATGRLMVSNRLDRELAAVHRLVVRAETDTSPALLATTQITVKLVDENDHAPEFAASPYRVSVLETVAPHTQILQVLATDRDIANNGEISYSFSEETQELAAHLFSIDPHHGWVTTTAQLDYEQEQSYKLTIVAEDNGSSKRSTTTALEISMVDSNDNPPEFSQRLYSAAVNEGALPGTIIFQLETEDADKTVVSPVEFFITSGDPRGQFQIKENGEVYVARGLDRETTAQYRLEVAATDGKFVTQCRVNIEILDDNDSPPYCSAPLYRQEVAESLPAGSPLLTVTATDADEGQNARQEFSLSGETAEMFSVERWTGRVSTALPLDRETTASHALVVHVRDAGRPEWECTSRVQLTLTDTNDNPPVWSRQQFDSAVREDTAVGSILTKVHATDLDLGENRRITYSFLDSGAEGFAIDSKTGIVSLAQGLDRELRDSFNLTVRAMDSGRPRLSALASLVVRVMGESVSSVAVSGRAD